MAIKMGMKKTRTPKIGLRPTKAKGKNGKGYLKGKKGVGYAGGCNC